MYFHVYIRCPSSGMFGGLLGHPVRDLIYCFSLLFYFLWKLNLSIGTDTWLQFWMKMVWCDFWGALKTRADVERWRCFFVICCYYGSFCSFLCSSHERSYFFNRVCTLIMSLVCTNVDVKSLGKIMLTQKWECCSKVLVHGVASAGDHGSIVER